MMVREVATVSRNLFEIENARNLTRDEMVSTFVPTRAFWRLLSAKNHIVLGARGSGKTALAKMLSHDHLAQLPDERARQIIKAKAFIGIYVPTSIEWVGGLKNKPWQSEREAEELFQWRLNVSTCLAFLVTLRSCLDHYVADEGQRARVEEDLLQRIATSWTGGDFSCSTIAELQSYLQALELKRLQQIHRGRILGKLRENEERVGVSFEIDLFAPLRTAMNLVQSKLEFPADCTWLLCLDEAESLELFHHRVLNSYLRFHAGNLAFKITTMPYVHHTLDTNTLVPLDVGHDFEYVYIDQDPIHWSGRKYADSSKFAQRLFAKRAQISGSKYQGLTLISLLGPSLLLDPKMGRWGYDSVNMGLLRKYGTPETVQRAQRLANSKTSFMNQIARKMHGTLLLRSAVENLRGQKELDVYSGSAMIMRCSDGNPRRLIRILNSLLLQVRWSDRRPRNVGNPILSPTRQNRVLFEFSESTIARVQSEEKYGPQLHTLLMNIGDYMYRRVHQQLLSTDQISSVQIDSWINENTWELIKRAVGLGLLFPNVNTNNPDQMPEREGIFHLAYVLAPYFRLLPRRGKSLRLSAFVNARPSAGLRSDPNQLPLAEMSLEGRES